MLVMLMCGVCWCVLSLLLAHFSLSFVVALRQGFARIHTKIPIQTQSNAFVYSLHGIQSTLTRSLPLTRRVSSIECTLFVCLLTTLSNNIPVCTRSKRLHSFTYLHTNCLNTFQCNCFGLLSVCVCVCARNVFIRRSSPFISNQFSYSEPCRKCGL